MKFIYEFLEFMKKYQVLGLAIAFIIGAASTKLVTATVNDIIMPLISLLLPAGDWRQTVLEIGQAKLLIGDFLGAVIDFLIIAIFIFLVVKFLIKENKK